MITATPIVSEEQLADQTSSGILLLLKLSSRCPISHYAEAEARRFLAKTPLIFKCGTIDVIGKRPLSQQIAASTSIKHESPQAILFVDGIVKWHESHSEITEESLRQAIEPYAISRG